MPVISKIWSRHKILAEIKYRGYTTIKLDAKLVLRPNDIAVSLNRPFPKADKALARWLEIPLHDLWPSRYDSNGARLVQQTNPNREIIRGSSKMGEAA
ncbi:MAG: helix-turn-helix domain-containing protein [Alphaproteobacteria bacterium]|nr:helix-turn-helix domain-containing protein [Alphaproteobacteria bacterium]